MAFWYLPRVDLNKEFAVIAFEQSSGDRSLKQFFDEEDAIECYEKHHESDPETIFHYLVHWDPENNCWVEIEDLENSE